MTKCVRRSGVGVLCWMLALPLSLVAQADGFEVTFSVGQALYSAGPTGEPLGGGGGAFFRTGSGSCDESGAFVTNYNVQLSKGAFAADLTFNHTDWPWDDWPLGEGGGPGAGGAAQDFVQRHGNGFEIAALFRPAEAVDLRVTHRDGYTFQPLVGLGVQITTDADDDSPASAPIYLTQGQTNLMLTYGFSLDVHPGSLSERGVALRVQLLGKRGIRSEAEFATPGGPVTLHSEDSNWATLLFGLTFRPGGFSGRG